MFNYPIQSVIFILVLIPLLFVGSYWFIHYNQISQIVFPSSNSEIANNSQVSNETTGPQDFTLMIYMIGSDLESDSLEASRDIKEILKGHLSQNIKIVLQTGGSKEPTNKSTIDFSQVKRYQVFENNLTELQDLGIINMGDVSTLIDFINWTTTNFDADKYGLIMWDHGKGIEGFGKDDNFGGDAIHISEFIDLIDAIPKLTNYNKLEFIGFDSCLMATIEVASILEPVSNYLISSQEIEPNWGWNYTDIVNNLSNNNNISGDSLGKQIIQSYILDSKRYSQQLKFNADKDITLSVIDLKNIPILKEKLDELVSVANYELSQKNAHFRIMHMVDKTESFGKSATTSIGSVDLYDLLNNLERSIPSLKNIVNSVQIVLESAVVDNYGGSAHPNAKGLSIFFPITKDEFKVISDLKIKHNVTVFPYSVDWFFFINKVGFVLDTDAKPTLIQSMRNNDTIIARTFDPDIQKINKHIILKSDKGNLVQYIQQLNSSLMDNDGYFKYNNYSIMGLCNELTCVPVSSTLEIKKDLIKYYIPVEISTKFGQNKTVSLVYELKNNTFAFLGGLDEDQITRGGAIAKEKMNLLPGDVIVPMKGIYTNEPYFVTDSHTLYDKISNSFENIQKDQYLTVDNPLNLLPKFMKMNSSSVQFSFCDFSNKCEFTRKYSTDAANLFTNSISENYTNKAGLTVIQKDYFNNTNRYLYTNPQFNFSMSYPSDWIASTVDLFDDNKFNSFINDPLVVELFPMESIRSGNGSDHSLRTKLSIAVQEEDPNLDVKRYYKYFKSSPDKSIITNAFKYSIIDSNETRVDNKQAFEFLSDSQKINNNYGIKDERRLLYLLTVFANNKEYLISFEAEKKLFDKYIDDVHNIIKTIRFSSPDILENLNSGLEIVNETSQLIKAQKILKEKLQESMIWKEYNDTNHNFTISYPYIDSFNNPVNSDLLMLLLKTTSNIPFIIPSIEFFGNPHHKPLVDIEISPVDYKLKNLPPMRALNKVLDNTEDLKLGSIFWEKKIWPNYTLINRTFDNSLTGNPTVVLQERFFFPSYNSMVEQKHSFTIIKDKIISIRILTLVQDQFYDNIYNTMVKSFKME